MASPLVPAWGVAEATFDGLKWLPPGYRFQPMEEELVGYYLKRKIDNQPIPIKEISEVNIYDHNPQTLAESYPPLGDNVWYFFTPRERKYKNGLRPNRRAGTGFWKATGKDDPIKDSTIGTQKGAILGYKKSLVFHEGQPPKGIKTRWGMHEFTLGKPDGSRRGSADMKLDDWVLCRIYVKVKRGKNKKKRRRGSDGNVSTGTTDGEDESHNYKEIEVDRVGVDYEQSVPLVDNTRNLDLAFVMENHDLFEEESDYNSVFDWLTMNNMTSGNNNGYYCSNNSYMNNITFGLDSIQRAQQSSFQRPTDFLSWANDNYHHDDKRPRIEGYSDVQVQQVPNPSNQLICPTTSIDASQNDAAKNDNSVRSLAFWFI